MCDGAGHWHTHTPPPPPELQGEEILLYVMCVCLYVCESVLKHRIMYVGRPGTEAVTVYTCNCTCTPEADGRVREYSNAS